MFVEQDTRSLLSLTLCLHLNAKPMGGDGNSLWKEGILTLYILGDCCGYIWEADKDY